MIIKGKIKERQVWELVLGSILCSTFIVFGVLLFVEKEFLLALCLSLVLLLGLVPFAELTLSEKYIWLDTEQRRLKNYRKYLFLTLPFGRWNALPLLEKCVLRSRKEFVKTSGSRSSWHTFGYNEMNYRIYLVNRSIKYSLLIHHTTNEETAQAKLHELSQALNIRSEMVAD